MSHDVCLRPDYRQYLAENAGMIVLFCINLLAVPLSARTTVEWFPLMVVLLSLVTAVALVVRYVMLCAVKWVIGDDTICRIEGVLSKRTDYVELYRVVDYQENQTFLQKMFNVKTVTVISTDKSDAILEMYGVSDSIDLVRIIRDRVEKSKKEKRIYEITNR